MAWRKALFWKKDRSSMALLIKERFWGITRPVPMVMWPTSELPTSPKARPTSSSAALTKKWGKLDQRKSRVGVLAARMALPSD